MTFSIVIPVYNVAPYLRACLDSVFSQTYDHWECICVDDGSTDGSGAILDEYAANVRRSDKGGLCRFKVLHQNNAGVSAARNAALDVVTGEWVIFLDADDCLNPDLLRCCRESAGDSKIDMVMFERESFTCRHSITDFCARPGKSVIDLSHTIPYEVAEADFWQFAYASSLLKGLRFPRYTMGEDRLFLAWGLKRARSVLRLNGVGYYYRQREGSAVNSAMSWRKLRDDISHSVRRAMAFVFCCKHVEGRVYRHQIGLWLSLIRRLV